MEPKYYTIEYRLEQDNGSIISHTLAIDEHTQVSRSDPLEVAPEWTKLSHKQCENCTLQNSDYCPVALRLVTPIHRFRSMVSHTRVTATVVTPARTYVKQADAQEAIRSLFGLIMATSGCPSMHPFKFMARHHLPFSTVEETVSRVLTTYLLGQFFRYPQTDPESPQTLPVDLHEIDRLYKIMQELNESMARRLRNSAVAESAMNAIIIFSAYSSLIPMMMDKQIRQMRPLFLES